MLRTSTPPARVRSEPALRNWQRVSVCVPSELFSLEGNRTALVVNLCTRGAMLEMPLPPKAGSEVILLCGAIEAEGEVVWQSGERCGIWFHTPIEDAELDSEAAWSRTLLARLLTG